MSTDRGLVRSDVDTDQLTAAVTELAADVHTGRRVGTAGGREAGAWLVARLRALGATVSTQEFSATVVREPYAASVMQWDGTRLRHRRDVAEPLASADLSAPRTGGLVVEASPPTQPIPILWVRIDLHARMIAQRGSVTASTPVRTVAVTG